MKKELVCEQRGEFWFYSIFCYKGSLLKKEALYIDDSDTNKYVKYINENKCNKVAIYICNSNLESLEFLHSINCIEYLAIIGDARNIDCSPVYSLNNLRYLIFDQPRELYLDKFKKLEFFSTNGLSHVRNVEQSVSLRTLSLGSAFERTEYEDLSAFSELKSLEVLCLRDLDLVSLKGIGQFARLKVLEIDGLKKLRIIESIIQLKSTLTSLRIYDCNRIQSLDSIASLRYLRFLSLDNLKHIPNLDFIASLPSLKTFISSDSTIVDGNMTNLERIATVVVLPSRKSYYVADKGETKRYKQKDLFLRDRDLGEEEVEQWRRISY